MNRMKTQKLEEDCYMQVKIKCELMTTWDFDHCIDCKRLRTRNGKGLKNWSCTLNRATAKERRDFGMIWASAFLQDHGYNISIPEVTIIPIGNRKQKG